MKNKLVSVIIPAYKQEALINYSLKKIIKVLEKINFPFELICVVDGKNDDKTFENALKFAKGKKNIKILGYDENKGKGYAVRFGMAKSQGNIVGFIDSGSDIQPLAIPLLIKQFQQHRADIVIGSKRHPASKIQYTWQRKIPSLGYQILIKMLFGVNFRDTQVGLKFYRREVLREILPKLTVTGYAFDIEMLSVAYSFGFTRIFEAPVEVKLEFKGNSNITSHKLMQTILRMIFDTAVVFYRLKISKYYAKKILPEF